MTLLIVQGKKGVTHRGNTHLPQVKCTGGQRYEITDLGPFSTSQLEDLRKILVLGSHYIMMTRNLCNMYKSVYKHLLPSLSPKYDLNMARF